VTFADTFLFLLAAALGLACLVALGAAVGTWLKHRLPEED